jgi:pimeloyl-ACP methyl ester carboxylesterase
LFRDGRPVPVNKTKGFNHPRLCCGPLGEGITDNIITALGWYHSGHVVARGSTLPKIAVPTIVIHGAVDEVNPAQKSEGHKRYFTGHYERRVFENVGHNPPQEDPSAFASAVLDLCKRG